MRNLEGESDRGLLRAFFDRRLKFEFGSRFADHVRRWSARLS